MKKCQWAFSKKVLIMYYNKTLDLYTLFMIQKNTYKRIKIKTWKNNYLTFWGISGVLASSSPPALALSLLRPPLSCPTISFSPTSSFPAPAPAAPTPFPNPRFSSSFAATTTCSFTTTTCSGGGCCCGCLGLFSLLWLTFGTAAAAAAARRLRVLVAIASPSTTGFCSRCCFAAPRPLFAPLRNTGIVHPSNLILLAQILTEERKNEILEIFTFLKRRLPPIKVRPKIYQIPSKFPKPCRFKTKTEESKMWPKREAFQTIHTIIILEYERRAN